MTASRGLQSLALQFLQSLREQIQEESHVRHHAHGFHRTRSLSLVTTAGLMSTQTSFTPAGVMLPTPMEWSMEESISIKSAPLINANSLPAP